MLFVSLGTPCEFPNLHIEQLPRPFLCALGCELQTPSLIASNKFSPEMLSGGLLKLFCLPDHDITRKTTVIGTGGIIQEGHFEKI